MPLEQRFHFDCGVVADVSPAPSPRSRREVSNLEARSTRSTLRVGAKTMQATAAMQAGAIRCTSPLAVGELRTPPGVRSLAVSERRATAWSPLLYDEPTRAKSGKGGFV